MLKLKNAMFPSWFNGRPPPQQAFPTTVCPFQEMHHTPTVVVCITTKGVQATHFTECTFFSVFLAG